MPASYVRPVVPLGAADQRLDLQLIGNHRPAYIVQENSRQHHRFIRLGIMSQQLPGKFISQRHMDFTVPSLPVGFGQVVDLGSVISHQ